MPSPAADQLTAGYRLSQYNAAQQIAAYVVARWALHLASANPRWGTAWINEVLPLLIRARESQRVPARAYYRTLRVLETGDRRLFPVPDPEPFDPTAIAKSLSFTGLRPYTRQDAQRPAIDPAAVQTAIQGSVARHVMNGGRETIAAAQQADPVAVGYYRDTDGDPCFFCAMLASRGIVYREDSFDESDPRFEGDGKAKVHDHCACINRPAFSRDIVLPETNSRAFETWQSLTGKDALGRPIDNVTEFRQRWEGRYELPDGVVE